MPTKIELEAADYGRDEMLHLALDRAVRRGALRVEAVKDAMDLYAGKSVIDEKTMEITLNGRPLDEALVRIIEQRKLWQVTGDDPVVKARGELEAAALAGNVSAHGQLWKQLGDAGYEAWKKAHRAAPGKPAADDGRKRNADGTFIADDDAETNPFKKAAWSLTAQGQIAKRDPALAARLAKAAGIALGATRPVM
jgi:hypothetical protein